MKPIASTLYEEDTFDGEEIKFSISEANSAWVMRSMADLYSNRELACVREYSTNAFDANLDIAKAEGRNFEPIEVTLPTFNNPKFIVKDYGLGMSRSELTEIYTQFGESTKRNNDDANGMLGFGSKSAIAYTNTFTVTSIHQGKKYVAIISRREDDMGGYLVTMKIVLELDTTEHSGVTIEIPVHNWRQFNQVAEDFYRFWRPGTVKVNGVEPTWAVGDKIDDNLYYYPRAGTSYVVMGNVPYRIENPVALFPRGMNQISFVGYVPMGAVEFTPSRESLKYSEHTKKNLHAIIDNFVAKSKAQAVQEISNAKDHWNAFELWTKWRNMIGASQVEDLTFKGDKFEADVKVNGSIYVQRSTRYNTNQITEFPLEHMKTVVIITDFSPELSSRHKKMARSWAELNHLSVNYFVFTKQDSIKSPWVDQNRVISWDALKASLPKKTPGARTQSTAPGRLAGSFDRIISYGLREFEKDVPSTKPLYHIMVKDYNRFKDGIDFEIVLKKYDIKQSIVIMPANRLDKYMRYYPHSINIMDHLRTYLVLDGDSLISEDALCVESIAGRDKENLRKLNSKNIDDPEIANFIELIAKEEELFKDYNAAVSLAKILGEWYNFKVRTRNNKKNSVRVLENKYPLINGYTFDNRYTRHATHYINSIYNAKKGGMNV